MDEPRDGQTSQETDRRTRRRTGRPGDGQTNQETDERTKRQTNDDGRQTETCRYPPDGRVACIRSLSVPSLPIPPSSSFQSFSFPSTALFLDCLVLGLNFPSLSCNY